jgi:hypothetical protein
MPRMPSLWWSSANMQRVFLPRMNHDGVPWDNRSETSGSARQIFRTCFSARSESRAVTIAAVCRNPPAPAPTWNRLGSPARRTAG